MKKKKLTNYIKKIISKYQVMYNGMEVFAKSKMCLISMVMKILKLTVWTKRIIIMVQIYFMGMVIIILRDFLKANSNFWKYWKKFISKQCKVLAFNSYL